MEAMLSMMPLMIFLNSTISENECLTHNRDWCWVKINHTIPDLGGAYLIYTKNTNLQSIVSLNNCSSEDDNIDKYIKTVLPNITLGFLLGSVLTFVFIVTTLVCIDGCRHMLQGQDPHITPEHENNDKLDECVLDNNLLPDQSKQLISVCV